MVVYFIEYFKNICFVCFYGDVVAIAQFFNNPNATELILKTVQMYLNTFSYWRYL